MFTERDIQGRWVAAEGIVYKDFKEKVHYVSLEEFDKKNIVKYFAGVDWGYEHFGSIVVIAEDDQGNVYLCEEHSHQYYEIDDWVKIAKEIKDRYYYK